MDDAVGDAPSRQHANQAFAAYGLLAVDLGQQREPNAGHRSVEKENEISGRDLGIDGHRGHPSGWTCQLPGLRANAFAGVESGVRVLDASCGGLGGCPFAPAATGNVATEDLAWMLHRAGFSTGVDVEAMIAAGRWIGERIGKPPVSALSRAGAFPPAP